MAQKTYAPATVVIHGNHVHNDFGALSTPIFQTSTFVFDSAEQGGRRFAGQKSGFIYSRLGNPTTSQLEQKIALLEGGEDCTAFSSGMGAISATLLSLLSCGDHLVADKTLYGCTFALIHETLPRFGIHADSIDMTDMTQVKAAIRPDTKVVYFETIANPSMKVTDIAAVADYAHAQNSDCIVIVDNTFATPLLVQPLKLGADVVVHSATKYLNGHGDVIAGFVVGSAEFCGEVRMFGLKDMTGAVMDPFCSFLILRGLKTLEIRMQKHCSNAKAIAEFLNNHPMVEKVYYPGLPSHVGHDIAARQMSDFGGMMSFEVKGGRAAGAKLVNALHLVTVAVSLGDAETLIEHPASMTHSTYTEEELAASGIAAGLIRLSVGLENAEDIIADLKQALDQL